jgi:hypothetical protein
VSAIEVLDFRVLISLAGSGMRFAGSDVFSIASESNNSLASTFEQERNVCVAIHRFCSAFVTTFIFLGHFS